MLGGYIGTAFDGLSGGGGAVHTITFKFVFDFKLITYVYKTFKVNNGQFIGNLLGTVYAQLSAVHIYYNF